MFHGVWLLGFVLLLSSVLQSIPVASLAGVLVYTGIKLVDVKAFRALGRYGRMPMFVHAATALAIVSTDLLTGVLVGFGLTLLKLAFKASRLKISLIDLPGHGEMELRLSGAATFLESAGINPRAVDGAGGNHPACTAEQPQLHRPFLPGKRRSVANALARARSW